MPSHVQVASESWAFPVWLTLAIFLVELPYIRGWIHLRSVSANVIPLWRACSFFLGLVLIWIAVGSPIAALDEKSLTVHMVQHLLLMTFAPPMIFLGAPVMPLLHGLQRQFVQTKIGPLFRWPALQGFGRTITRPAFCWFAAAAALMGWHVPAAFSLALRSEAWHVVEHSSFLGTGLLFWWPIVQPWPSAQAQLRWSILLYLFLATLPCDILSGLLVFSERVAYPAYLSTSQQSTLSVLADQQCAGALMWTCVTIVYLVAAAILTMRLLGPVNGSRENEMALANLNGGAVARGDSRSMEVV